MSPHGGRARSNMRNCVSHEFRCPHIPAAVLPILISGELTLLNLVWLDLTMRSTTPMHDCRFKGVFTKLSSLILTSEVLDSFQFKSWTRLCSANLRCKGLESSLATL
ncbi:hypothetical protein DFH06DRAFT_1334183 [Mycena polygramma]|nr:hypothetical protein DFH06DRAFT_1334183 [Mycena polygramma]